MASRADRNNNPGNLRPGAGRIIWNGQTGTDADGFAVFATREAGIRAADLNLQSYAKSGYDTVYSIIHRWSATDQDTYTASVASGIGVSPTAHLDLANAQVRQNLLAQIFNVEGSATRYSGGALSDAWASIQTAVASGNPIEIPGAIAGGIADGATNVVEGAIDSVSNAASGLWNFDLGAWIAKQVEGTAKDYLVPVAVGLGAIVLIMVSSWGLVKDTPVAKVVKTGARLAVV